MNQMLADIKRTEQHATGNKNLVIGLDFGAAFTKVVIGDNRVRYAVPFGKFAHPDNQYLVPSILNINDNNVCALSAAENASSTNANLKVPLLNNYTIEDQLRASAYLSLVLREAQRWLLDRYQDRYCHAKISWSINAGIPADSSNLSKLSALYKKLIHTAWTLSVLPGPITLNRVAQYMNTGASAFDAFPAAYRSRLISAEQINTLPACRAQICGYVHSRKCSDDLHLLVDIGAASINIATFNAAPHATENSGDYKCALYACAVEPIGVNYLLKRRYENLRLPDRDINLFTDIPDTHTFSHTYGLSEKEIMFADTLYSGDAARLINRILKRTKSKYHPNSNRWESGVLTLSCGGGVHMEIIQNILHRFENRKPPNKIERITLSVPDDLITENMQVDSFDRLSVAYGLSFDAAVISKAVAKENKVDSLEATRLPA